MDEVSDMIDAVSSKYVMPQTSHASHLQRILPNGLSASKDPDLERSRFGWFVVEAMSPNWLNALVAAF